MPQPENLAVLQQNRLEAARGRVLGFRDQVIRDTLTAAGLEPSEVGRFKLRLFNRIECFDLDTVHVLDQLKLTAGGMFTKPLLVAAQGGGDLAERTDSLRIKLEAFRGDMELVPEFELGYEGEDQGFHELTSFLLSTSYGLTAYQRQGRDFRTVNLEKKVLGLKLEHRRSAEAAGRQANRIFGVTLPEEAKLLFNDKRGLMKSEEELKLLIDFMSRRVDLSPESLSKADLQVFQELQPLCKDPNRNRSGLIDKIAERFGIELNEVKEGLLDGDMSIEMELVDVDGAQGLLVVIKDIALPKPKMEHAPFNLQRIVRPSGKNSVGNLEIDIWEFSGVSSRATRPLEGENYEDANIKTELFIRPEILAAILAKIKTN